ncbi:Rho GTPase activating protein [Ophidiomyces ophidiicola]|nr:Rho GTPase activating protein [Ophidiomyces ophidiicola]KAI1984968.1 Rho GTPase activating protein [Ophidiomyces ophidiicola]
MSHPRRHVADAEGQSPPSRPLNLPPGPSSSISQPRPAARAPPDHPSVAAGTAATLTPRLISHALAPIAGASPRPAGASSNTRSRQPTTPSQRPSRHAATPPLPVKSSGRTPNSTALSGFPVPPTARAHCASPTPSLSSILSASTLAAGPLVESPASALHHPSQHTASLASSSGSHTPSTPNPIHVSAMAESTGHRSVPRTSSIDSAISSLSSTSHSHKSSLDANVTPADIANLISAAGSPEAVIKHLLKEKQHAASQNAQLWKLVDKQRTMLLALNKDLERAVKEKEKYKKRLREYQNTPPPLPSTHPQNNDSQDNGISETGDSTQHHEPALRMPLRVGGTSGTASEACPTPMSLLQAADTDSKIQTGVTTDGSSPTIDSPSSPELIENRKSGRDDDGVDHPSVTSDTSQKTATLTKGDILPAPSGSKLPSKGTKVPPPSRKPPPAPLRLDEAQKVKLPVILDNRKDSDSEYDENPGHSEISNLERGRRRTREEDDWLRDAIITKEQEARSRSNKKKVKHFEPPESVQKEQAQAFLGVGLPSSPRSGVSSSPSPRLVAVNSPPPAQLSSVLQPGASDASGSDRSRVASPLSPGLPQSPRPEDRPIGSPIPRFPKDGGTLMSPPLSPQMNPGQFQNILNPTGAHLTTQNDKVEEVQSTFATDLEITNDIPVYKLTVEKDSPVSTRETPHTIYRGMVSSQYPDLLLPPNSLPLIDVKVSSSRLRPSRSSYLALKPVEEEPVFTLSVCSRTNGIELWRVEKAILSLPHFDQQVKQFSGFSGSLPERSIFSGHSPAKVDARRAALNTYFKALLTQPMDEDAALVVCQFLSTDAIEPRDDESNLLHGPGNGKPPISFGPDGKPRKEGYLTKRGKNFGGWKSRYFVLDGPELKYYESPGGPHLGTIKIQNAQIGKQSPSGKNQPPSQVEDDPENQYRHAFLVLEPKKRDSSALVRHVLCAESDAERDAWVETLLCYVEARDPDDEYQGSHSHISKSPSGALPRARVQTKKGSSENVHLGRGEVLQALSYDDVVAAEAPIRGPSGGKASPPPLSSIPDYSARQFDPENSSPTYKTISAPTNGMRIQDAGAWGNKTSATSTKEKKRSIWGFRSTAGMDFTGHNSRRDSIGFPYDLPLDRKGPIRPVFGLPLADAVEFCGPRDFDCGLPAVVYRCLDYLRSQHAELEEGIFRLSGSNVVIKALKERFNTEGDLDFSEGDSYYDVHAVASLFKQYLRELPTTVLTKELHLDFIRVLDLDEKRQKIAAFHALVHRLPRPNLDLLKALSQFLIVIINNADVNKMTVRNVGIVFAPTLNMPAPVFSMFLTEFDAIFGDFLPGNTTQPVEISVNISHHLTPEDIRSPRQQMFSDLPTPSYHQNSFESHGTEGNVLKYRQFKSDNDTGLIPMRPSYDPPPIPEQRHDGTGSSLQVQSTSGMLASNNPTTKNKRRESSLLFMGIGK